MGLFKRRSSKDSEGVAAVAERPSVARPTAVADDYPGSTDELSAEIRRLTEANRANRDRETERRLLHLRHVAGVRRLVANGASPEHLTPDFAHLPEAETLPEIAADDVTPELIRAGILRDGCLLVRGLIDRDAALAFAAQIDRSFEERERLAGGEPPPRATSRSSRPSIPTRWPTARACGSWRAAACSRSTRRC